MRRVAICLFAVVLAAIARADTPVDIPCVSWTPALEGVVPSNVNDLFVADVGCIECDPMSGECLAYTNIYPCFANSTNTWGHRDGRGNLPSDYSACHTQVGDNVIFAEHMYLPQKGSQWQTWHWQLTQRGAPVPDNAIRYGQSVMAMSINNGPGTCIGAGYTGWAVGKPDGTFGDVYFTTGQDPAQTNEFQVAICKAYVPTPAPTPVPPPTMPPTPGPTTAAPPTPVPTTAAPPTLPPNDKPYIRFGNAIATDNAVTATITQGSVSFTWTNYQFAQFSPWNELFSNGEGTISIYQGSTLLMQKTIPLTPGPLVVVTKGAWPPTNQLTSVETIAASYIPVPVPDTSGVRLFNLIDDLTNAGMSDPSGVLVNDIPYTLGSGWYPIPVEQLTFTIFNSANNKTLTSFSTTPPTPPYVFTAFLVGMANQTGTYGPRAVPLIDAPEALYIAAGYRK